MINEKMSLYNHSFTD